MNLEISYIKNIVESEYGIISPDAYIDYKKKKIKSGLTLDEINKLSPDTIDSGSFWEYVENHSIFNRDAISYGCKDTDDVLIINAKNYNLACKLGTLNYFFANTGRNLNFLDIGTGYGFLKNMAARMTKFNYYGTDVYPKIDDVYKIDDCVLPDEIMKLKFELIIATNVFQHLSVRQRNMYYQQITNILDPTDGVFSVSNIHNANKKMGFKCADNNKNYVCHYGQYTEIQSIEELGADISKYFNILSHSFLAPTSITFHCILKR